VLKRESRRFPWWAFLKWLAAVLLVLTLSVIVAVLKFQFHVTWHWPFLVR
jgi:predicted transcriptional regulator